VFLMRARLDSTESMMPSLSPPGPGDRLWGLPQLQQIRADLLGYYMRLAREYGDTVCLRLGPIRNYVFFHPEQIREVLVTKSRHFNKLPRLRKILAKLDGDGLVFSEGDFWLRQRRLVQPAFHTRRLEVYGQAMVERTSSLLNRWRRELGGGDSLTVDFEQAMTELTLAIVAATLFGSEPGAGPAELGSAVAALSEIFMHEVQAPLLLPDWLPLPSKARKRRAIRSLNETIDRIIRERRASGVDRNDLLSMLLLAVDEEGDRRGMSDRQARHEAMTLFIAGHDTTAAALTWIGYILSTQPDVAERATCELDAALAGRPPAYDDLPRMSYLEQVVKETLRLYPPAIGVFARQAVSDVEIGGYPLKKGSMVQLLSYVTQRDPRWFPDPERFAPERFAPERVDTIPAFAYFPFGGGPRVCVGNQFAMAEMVLVTATLLQALRFELAPDQGPVRLKPHLSLRPAGGLRLRLRRR
jgi:cytochrome P450